jgi:hypothetical protein
LKGKEGEVVGYGDGEGFGGRVGVVCTGFGGRWSFLSLVGGSAAAIAALSFDPAYHFHAMKFSSLENDRSRAPQWKSVTGHDGKDYNEP